MAVMVNTKYNEKDKKVALDTMFSLLDQGIADMEAGRLHPLEEAFNIIDERLKNDVQSLND